MSIALLIMCKDEFNKVRGIIKTIESVCEEKIVVIKSTVPPGTTNDLNKKYQKCLYKISKVNLKF